MKKILMTAILVGITVGTAASAFAQKVRLEGKINPNCTSSQGVALKFADIFADGNIAVMGSYGCRGAFIFDVSNPEAPALSNWYNPVPNQQFLEAIVIGNRGYFGSGSTTGGDGVHIVDLTNPNSPALLGKVNSSTGGGYNQIHEMMVFDQGGSRYLLENSNITSDRNLKIIDITNPAQPILRWNFLSTEAGWVHAMHIRGNKMYLSGFVSS